MQKYKLKNICEIQSGGTPIRSNESFFKPPLIPWAKVGDIKDEELVTTDEYLSEKGLKSIGNRVFPKGSLLLTIYGSVGKTTISRIELSTNQAILGINSKNNEILLNEYLKYWFDANKHRHIHKAKQGTIKNLSATYIKNIQIELPSIDYQRYFIDSMSQIQELIYLRKETIRLSKEYLQAVFVEMFGDPILDNKGIGKKPLSFFGEWKSGGTPPRSEEKYFKGNIPWFSSGELNSTYIHDSKEHITEEAIEITSAQKVKKGSLLLGMYDTAALKASITAVNCSCNQAVAFAKLNEEICTPIYIYYSIIMGRDYYLNKREGVRQKNLNLSKIKEIEILYPPKSEQQKFTEKFLLFKDQLNFYKKSQFLLEELFNSLLYQTFNQVEKKEDEIDILLNDEFEIEKLFSEVENTHEIETTTQYDILKDRLFQVLERTVKRNLENKDFKKGIVQVLDKNNVKLEYNKLYKLNNNEVS